MASDQNTAQTKTTVAINAVRSDIKHVAENLKVLNDVVKGRTHDVGEKEDTGEVIANLTIAYRSLEDASMRLGKALQAHDGGVSVYDKETTVGAAGGPDANLAKLGQELVNRLAPHAGERGDSEGAVEVLTRIIRERDAAVKEWPVESKGHAPIGG
jgi:hypothetical protein